MLLWETVKSPSCKITFFSWLFFLQQVWQGSLSAVCPSAWPGLRCVAENKPNLAV